MIQIFADGAVICDSRLESHDLQGLKVSSGLNKGGTAEIIMPPGHPAYGRFESYKTIVEIYRDGLLQFRGRPLDPTDDFYNVRTVLCEGELCFLDDAVSRPYLYQDSPAAVFASVIGVYNSQVEPFKQFKVGTVTVTDPNEYIRLESENAESVLATVNKLLERCGGYVVFTTDTDGARVINWYATLGYRSGQVIEFGENLLDFSRGGSNPELATAVLPYGAKDGGNGKRVTIESVNGEKDYIQDDEAVELRGFIIKPVVWDDVTEPANLLQKAQAWLAANRYIVTTLQLTALDLSYMDKNIDSYQVGDTIRVLSRPHKVDEDFLLTERTENLLNPENSQIQLGKELRTLTSADVAGDSQGRSELQKVTSQIASDYMLNVSDIVQETEKTLISLIEQTSEVLMLEVSRQYATAAGVQESITTTMTQLADSFEFLFNELKTSVDANDAAAREQFTELQSYIRFEDGNIILGKSGNEITLRLENDRILFLDDGAEVAYLSNKQLTVTDATFLNSMRIGSFAFIPRANGNLSLVKVGGA